MQHFVFENRYHMYFVGPHGQFKMVNKHNMVPSMQWEQVKKTQQ